MTNSQEPPALIRYECKRCEKAFVLPPSGEALSRSGKLHAFTMGTGKAFRYRESLRAAYGHARQQLLDEADDDAYQAFVQSFHFCDECQQFVCGDCWRSSRGTCKACAARAVWAGLAPVAVGASVASVAMEPVRGAVSSMSRSRRRLRQDFSMAALAIAMVLLALEGGFLLAVNPSQAPSAPGLADAQTTPNPGQTASATLSGTLSKVLAATAVAGQSAGSTTGPAGTATSKPGTGGPAKPNPTLRSGQTSTPTPYTAPTPTLAPGQTPPPTPIETPTPEPTPTAAPVSTPTGTPTPTPSPTAAPTDTPTPTPTPTAAPTDTPAPTDTLVPTAAPTDTPTPT